MNEKEIKNELKKIKATYLRALEEQNLTEEDKEIAITNFKFALKQAYLFYAVWTSDPGRLPAERPKSAIDSVHGFLNGVSRFFGYACVGLLSGSGILATLALLLSPAGPAVIVTLIALSMLGGIGGAGSLGISFIFKLFSWIPDLIINRFERNHREQVFQAVNQVTDIVINTLTTINTPTYVYTLGGLNVVPTQTNIQLVNPQNYDSTIVVNPVYERTVDSNNYQHNNDDIQQINSSYYKTGYGNS